MFLVLPDLHPDPLRQRYSSGDPDPYQNVTDPQRWIPVVLNGKYFVLQSLQLDRNFFNYAAYGNEGLKDYCSVICGKSKTSEMLTGA
jgi:hypothetical protein